MQWYFYVIIAALAAAAIIGIVFTVKRYLKIKNNGVETDAVVSRIKEVESANNDGSHDMSYVYYVKYQNEAGETVEAKLSSAPRFTTVGTQLRIKYLPEKPKFAIVVK